MRRPTVEEVSYIFYKVKELDLSVWRHDSEGNEILEHKILKCSKEDKWATQYLSEYKDCEIFILKPTKRNCLSIIAMDESYK